MIRRHRLAITVAILVIFAATFFYYWPIYAGCCDSRPFAGDTAQSRKGNVFLDNNRWRAEVESRMNNNTQIDTLGWVSWHVYEMCNNQVIEYTHLLPVAAHNVSYQGRIYEQRIENCNGSRMIGNRGHHQYEEGSNSITPWVEYVINFPN